MAELNSEAFAWIESDKMEPGLVKQYTEDAEKFYRQSIYQDSRQQLKRALHDKQQAARSSREATLRQQSKKIRAEIARLQGQPVPALPLENRLEKVALRSWRRKRQFMCLAVEERSSRRVVASCILSLAAPDALLPAPFPTSKPWRLYCSNMAVDPDHQRKRLAAALLRKCQQIGALWGYPDMWLHVDIINERAQKLYKGAGFGIHSQDPWYYVLGRKRYLMRKDLPGRLQSPNSANSSAFAQGSLRSSDGVYIWDVESKSNSSVSDAQQSVPSDADSQ